MYFMASVYQIGKGQEPMYKLWTVLRGGNPRASIIVVPISVVAAAALGHTLHLVLIEERLAGRALRVAAWGGRRAGRRLAS